jgi:hypothetical protein
MASTLIAGLRLVHAITQVYHRPLRLLRIDTHESGAADESFEAHGLRLATLPAAAVPQPSLDHSGVPGLVRPEER